MEQFQKKLEGLGLSDKEALVYAASLSLGASPVQAIAAQAGIKRPTAYLVVEALKNKGLMSSVEKGKKTLFIAEDPINLERLVDSHRREVDLQSKGLNDLISQLKLFFHSSGDRPSVRFYDGVEGVETLRQQILLDPKYNEVRSMTNFDKLFELFPNQTKYTNERIKRKIKSKFLYTSKKGPITQFNDPSAFREARYIPSEEFPFEGDFAVVGDSAVVITSFRNKPSAVYIESKEHARVAKALFDLAWERAKAYQK